LADLLGKGITSKPAPAKVQAGGVINGPRLR
jgi:hypothetical protein